VADYQARVPLREYRDFKPFWQRSLAGESHITWPGRPVLWAKTSGTTGGDKLIPVTREAFRSHRKGGRDALLEAVDRVGAERLLGGPLLMLGGSTNCRTAGEGCEVGDLSGLVVRRLPPGIRGRYSPGAEVAGIAGWDERVEAAARVAGAQDIRLVSGMPSWLVVFFERLARQRRETGRPLQDLGECWPGLRVLIHGGVAYGPYARVIDQWIGRPLERIEVYPASEAFVALETERDGSGLTPLLDHDVFYEFVPVEDLASERPRRHTVADVGLDRAYAVVVTTAAGLWSYLLGDTVRFTRRDPLRLVITGRTRHYVNAFGENVIVEEVEHALEAACRRAGAEAAEFTVAPRYPTRDDARGGHEWLVEFRRPPDAPAAFARALDEALADLNADYRTKRAGDVGMVAPVVTALPRETFLRWLRAAGKLGDQHKVPRVMNDRAVADAVLAAAGPDAPFFAPASAARGRGVTEPSPSGDAAAISVP
jgi:hypothetical protein